MGSEKDQFPQVQGGGSLILAWQIKDKNVLVVGGGEVREPLQPKSGTASTPICLVKHA